jgi:ABC-type branched-subunit amino acid transport system substrate-binding protein
MFKLSARLRPRRIGVGCRPILSSVACPTGRLRARRSSALALLLTFLLVSSACSSVTRLGTGTGVSSSRAGANKTTAVSSDAASSGSVASGSVAGGSVAGGSVAGGSVAGGSVAGGSVAGSGSCTTPYVIGYTYSSDLNGILAAAGHPEYAAQAGDYTARVKEGGQLAVDDLNQRGGLHGCPVKLVFHDFKTGSSDGWDAESQKECTDYTQDQPASLVVPSAAEGRVLVQCLSQHGGVLLTHGVGYYADQSDYAEFRGHLYSLTTISFSRMEPYIDMWAAAGYFADPGTKVGILVAQNGNFSNDNSTKMVNSKWVPKLKAMGFDPVVQPYDLPNTLSDASVTQTQMSQAVLNFKANGVNHVLLPPQQGYFPFFFAQTAESQGFRPRYGVTQDTAAWPGLPAGQRPRAVGISNTPLDAGADEALRAQNPPSATRDNCLAIYTAGNKAPDYEFCDVLQWLQTAFANEDPSNDALLRGVEALSSSYQSGVGFGGTRFGPNRYDGLAQVRVMHWDESTTSWSYGTPPLDLP